MTHRTLPHPIGHPHNCEDEPRGHEAQPHARGAQPRRRAAGLGIRAAALLACAAALLLPALSACETDSMYSSAYCRFTFSTTTYPTSALTRAVGSTGGDFCIVKAATQNGVTHLLLTPNRGTYSATDLNLTLSTAIGNERISYAAMGYRQGLVIGRNIYGQLRAYDLQCPNCDNNYELHWDAAHDQQLQCDKCRRTYNIEGDYGYVADGERGHALTLYRNVSYSPDNGRLLVSNP